MGCSKIRKGHIIFCDPRILSLCTYCEIAVNRSGNHNIFPLSFSREHLKIQAGQVRNDCQVTFSKRLLKRQGTD